MRRRGLLICILLLIAFAVGCVFGVKIYEKQSYPQKYQSYVTKYCSEYSVPEPLVYAVIRTESSFKPDAVSPVGAQGLMQLMPDTFSWLARLIEVEHKAETITDPETNIRFGTYYLRHLYDRFGNWDTALAAYNAGHGRVTQWLADSRYSDDGIVLKRIPYKETYNFVKRVNSSTEKYKELYYGE